LLTLEIKPSKRLILFYSLLYSISFIAVIYYAPYLIIAVILELVLCVLTMLILLPLYRMRQFSFYGDNSVDIMYRAFLWKAEECHHYESIQVNHRGRELIILQLLLKQEKRKYYLFCFWDSFSKCHFAALQRYVYFLEE
jgi:hypothetical protein